MNQILRTEYVSTVSNCGPVSYETKISMFFCFLIHFTWMEKLGFICFVSLFDEDSTTEEREQGSDITGLYHMALLNTRF